MLSIFKSSTSNSIYAIFVFSHFQDIDDNQLDIRAVTPQLSEIDENEQQAVQVAMNDDDETKVNKIEQLGLWTASDLLKILLKKSISCF